MMSTFIDLWKKRDKTTKTLFFCSFYSVLHLLHSFFFCYLLFLQGSQICFCGGLTGTRQIVSGVHAPFWVLVYV